MSEPREMTEVEARRAFLAHVRAMVDYWDREARPGVDVYERLDGLAFSILVAIDGGAGGLPAFILAPCPHPDNRAYHQELGENWWPENDESAVRCDIGGGLHEEFCRPLAEANARRHAAGLPPFRTYAEMRNAR